MDSEARERTIDEIFDALGHVQRRELLRSLVSHDPQDDDSVVIGPDESPDEELTRLVETQHMHLPKLEEYGFIAWNQKDREDELPNGWL